LTSHLNFQDHPLADESLARPPLSRIDAVCIGPCLTRLDMDLEADEEYRYKPPAALTINNEDGSAITLRQFVSEAHAYLNEHMDEIKKLKGEMYGKLEIRDDGTRVRTITYGQSYFPPDIALFFRRVHAVSIDEAVQISVDVFAEGEFDWTTDEFWTIQRRQAKHCEDKRGGRPRTDFPPLRSVRTAGETTQTAVEVSY